MNFEKEDCMRQMSTLVACAVVCASSAVAAANLTTGADERSWSFKVFLDDREIGYHDFRVVDTPAGRELDSEARFDVKVLFINAYKYRHESHERWDDGCLVEIDARTRAGSERNALAGRDVGQAFALQKLATQRKRTSDTADPTDAPAVTYESDCVSTFAYWNPDFLSRDRLLNPQTGDLVPVHVESMGVGTVQVAGVETAVERYRINTPDGEVEVSYARVGGEWEWVALESPIEGRILRYVRQGPAFTPERLSTAQLATDGAQAGDAP
jgi:hypothetical protein